MATLAPCAANWSAAALPIPEFPPVTMIVLFSNCFTLALFLAGWVRPRTRCHGDAVGSPGHPVHCYSSLSAAHPVGTRPSRLGFSSGPPSNSCTVPLMQCQTNVRAERVLITRHPLCELDHGCARHGECNTVVCAQATYMGITRRS